MNILVLTSEYPGNFKDPNNNITPVVHYFAREWVKQGHNVIVIHNAHRFPYIIHALPKTIKDDFTLKHGFSIMGTDYIRKDAFELEGVRVWRLPIVKYIPHGDHFHYTIKKHAKKIENILNELHFTPEVIIGHWASPQMQLIRELKPIYNCKTALTLHDLTYLKGSRFEYRKYIEYIDKIGFRNKADKERAANLLKNKKPMYICYSGIPKSFLEMASCPLSKFSNIKKLVLIYVGRLIERKHIDSTIQAIHNSKIKEYEFHIVGAGPQEKELRDLVSQLDENNNVFFHGRLKREEIIDLYKKAHVFVMASSGEAFGLVYIEAMAAGCIAIGSIDEGIDGIIINAENGFLCRSGDIDEQISIFNKINEYDTEKLLSIARNSVQTASEMSDGEIAMKYLDEVIK